MTPTKQQALEALESLTNFAELDDLGDYLFAIVRAYIEQAEPSGVVSGDDAVCRPDILERLTYHALERDDMTLDDCMSYMAKGWAQVRGRTERQLVMQILALLAAAPKEPTK